MTYADAMMAERAEPPNPTPAQIRAWRVGAGLTQRQAGELVHSTERQWQRWETGTSRMMRAVWEYARIVAADPRS